MPLPPLLTGQRNHRIEIKRSAKISDGKGGWTTGWATIATPWAEVQGQDGREALVGQALQGISTYRIRIAWRADAPKPADQIRYGDLDLNIRSVSDPNGDRQQLVIFADTGSAQPTA